MLLRELGPDAPGYMGSYQMMTPENLKTALLCTYHLYLALFLYAGTIILYSLKALARPMIMRDPSYISLDTGQSTDIEEQVFRRNIKEHLEAQEKNSKKEKGLLCWA